MGKVKKLIFQHTSSIVIKQTVIWWC